MADNSSGGNRLIKWSKLLAIVFIEIEVVVVVVIVSGVEVAEGVEVDTPGVVG